ncbi:hypothetical protein DFH08DRAFT_812015 [Mycena albidolilacea]|uniref:Uncharacterized protein n=1 Tax=Mycena albidolilacea TaxID=1033008 RepID=A0AAD7EMT2_9AGAR|nr:hypothetical protein DFH08DRAFT_812015 [Mycena albidolilacea]
MKQRTAPNSPHLGWTDKDKTVKTPLSFQRYSTWLDSIEWITAFRGSVDGPGLHYFWSTWVYGWSTSVDPGSPPVSAATFQSTQLNIGSANKAEKHDPPARGNNTCRQGVDQPLVYRPSERSG